MLEGAAGEEARESACRDIHEVWPLYHRRGIEVEGYGDATTTDGIVIRRGSINPEVARLDSGRIHWSAHVDNKISQLGEHSAVTGRLGTDH